MVTLWSHSEAIWRPASPRSDLEGLQATCKPLGAIWRACKPLGAIWWACKPLGAIWRAC